MSEQVKPTGPPDDRERLRLYPCNTPAQGFNAEREQKVRAELLRQVRLRIENTGVGNYYGDGKDPVRSQAFCEGADEYQKRVLTAIDRIAKERGIEL